VYDREASVIYPPVELDRFTPAAAPDDYYLVVSALVPYKRVDLAVRAATATNRRLLVVGRGPEEPRLRALAGPSVTFLGWRSDAEVARLYARCRAVLFPSVEDFGIVPLEAAASGRPTIALASGGALETMVGLDGGAAPTAVFFQAQTVEAVAAAMAAYEASAHRFEPAALRAHAARFDRPRFAREIGDWIATRWAQAARAC
jgi:glycosyltransferase involved in cell wall biosynthesis